jgi:hypothetical protein
MAEKWMAEKCAQDFGGPGPRHLFMPLQHSLVEGLTQPGGLRTVKRRKRRGPGRAHKLAFEVRRETGDRKRDA